MPRIENEWLAAVAGHCAAAANASSRRLRKEAPGKRPLRVSQDQQPTLLAQVTATLSGTDADFAATPWTEEGQGHGRRERRSICTAPSPGSTGPAPPTGRSRTASTTSATSSSARTRRKHGPAVRPPTSPHSATSPSGHSARRVRQHRPRPPLPLPRRSAHPRPLRVRLIRHQVH